MGQEKKTKAFEKLQKREEKKRQKEVAAKAEPKRRGRPSKLSPDEVDHANGSVETTAAEKISPEKKKQRRKTSTADAPVVNGPSHTPASSTSTGTKTQPKEKPAVDGQKPPQPKEKPSVDGDGKGGAASAKRLAKAKLALQKLADNMGSQDVKELYLPGPAFDKMSYTLPAPNLSACSIGVLLYTETFYIYKNAKVPEYLKEQLQAWFLDSFLIKCKCRKIEIMTLKNYFPKKESFQM